MNTLNNDLNVTGLMSCIRNSLNELQLAYTEHSGLSGFTLNFDQENAGEVLRLCLMAIDENCILATVRLPFVICLERRKEALTVANCVNRQNCFGAVSVDMETGHVNFRFSLLLQFNPDTELLGWWVYQTLEQSMALIPLLKELDVGSIATRTS